jgi:hypothetical protein
MLLKFISTALLFVSSMCFAQSNIDEMQIQQQQEQTNSPPKQTNKDDCPDCKRIKELQQQKNQFYSPGFEVKYKNRNFKRKCIRLKRKISYVFSKPKKNKPNNNCFAWK